MLVDFTDDLFIKTIVSSENTPTPENSPQIDDLPEFATFQDALNAIGIVRPRAPGQLPEGFELDFIQVAERPDYVIATAQYKSGESFMTITFRLYSEASDGRTQYVEKDGGDPIVYSYSDIEVYIFENIDTTVATWVDGMLDCNIQGTVSVTEIKTILKSMYTED
jgi:hypothetical protein